MKIDRSVFLLLAGALAACQSKARSRAEPPEAEPPPDASSGATPPPADAAPPSLPDAEARARPCERLLGENRRVLGALARPPTLSSVPTEDLCPAPQPRAVQKALKETWGAGFFDYCQEGHGGAWAIALDRAELMSPAAEGASHCGAMVSYRIVFLAHDGARASSTLRQSYWGEALDPIGDFFPWPFDLDGDGNDELIVRHEDRAFVLRARGAVAEDYPVGFDFDDVIDADGDGRPDLLARKFFLAPKRCFGLYEIYFVGASLLVHSLPDGSFTMGDLVARRWARLQCPSAAGPVTELDAAAASCQRIWGQSVVEIMRGVKRPEDDCGFDEDRESFAKMLGRPLPFPPLRVATPPPLPRSPRPPTRPRPPPWPPRPADDGGP